MLLSVLAVAASQPPTFAAEFALDYHVANLMYGFVAVGRWTVDHKNSTGHLNLRERTDSYNMSLEPRAEVNGLVIDYGAAQQNGYDCWFVATLLMLRKKGFRLPKSFNARPACKIEGLAAGSGKAVSAVRDRVLVVRGRLPERGHAPGDHCCALGA